MLVQGQYITSIKPLLCLLLFCPLGADGDMWARGRPLPPARGGNLGGGMRGGAVPNLPALHKTESAFKVSNLLDVCRYEIRGLRCHVKHIHEAAAVSTSLSTGLAPDARS